MTGKPLDCAVPTDDARKTDNVEFPTLDEICEAHKILTSGSINKVPTGDRAPIPVLVPDTVTLCESEKQNHINSSCESTVCLSREMVDCVLSFIEELGVFGGKYPYVNGTQLLVDSRQILTKLRAEMEE